MNEEATRIAFSFVRLAASVRLNNTKNPLLSSRKEEKHA